VQAQVPHSQQEGEDKLEEPKRRNLILGSAAALTAALLSAAPRPSQAFAPRQSQASSTTTVILEDSEARRIDIFERNAPSVVFIDTFTEKQDTFSTNIMEVPLGSGSGFVWDKEGHIGEYGRLVSIPYRKI
jgi:S1-C subfamily serine protease